VEVRRGAIKTKANNVSAPNPSTANINPRRMEGLQIVFGNRASALMIIARVANTGKGGASFAAGIARQGVDSSVMAFTSLPLI